MMIKPIFWKWIKSLVNLYIENAIRKYNQYNSKYKAYKDNISK